VCSSLCVLPCVFVVEELRGRDLPPTNWVVLMLDGIRLSKHQLAIAAIEIDSDGRKHVLDFELGSSGSSQGFNASIDETRR